jgi:hypothetical protein
MSASTRLANNRRGPAGHATLALAGGDVLDEGDHVRAADVGGRHGAPLGQEFALEHAPVLIAAALLRRVLFEVERGQRAEAGGLALLMFERSGVIASIDAAERLPRAAPGFGQRNLRRVAEGHHALLGSAAVAHDPGERAGARGADAEAFEGRVPGFDARGPCVTALGRGQLGGLAHEGAHPAIGEGQATRGSAQPLGLGLSLTVGGGAVERWGGGHGGGLHSVAPIEDQDVVSADHPAWL